MGRKAPPIKYMGGNMGHPSMEFCRKLYHDNKETHPIFHDPFFGAGGSFFMIEPERCEASDMCLDVIIMHEWIKSGGLLLDVPTTGVTEEIYVRIRQRFNDLRKFTHAGYIGFSDEEVDILLNAELDYPIGHLKVFKKYTEEKISQFYDWLDEENFKSKGTQMVADILAAVEDRVNTDFLWMNRANYNGRYRLSKKSGYNVPWGKKDKVYIPDQKDLTAYAKLYKRVSFNHIDYQEASDFTVPKFALFDPPYWGTTSDYTLAGFDEDDHRALADHAAALAGAGWIVCIQNSLNADTKGLYKERGFELFVADKNHTVSCQKEGRGKKEELFGVKMHQSDLNSASYLDKMLVHGVRRLGEE